MVFIVLALIWTGFEAYTRLGHWRELASRTNLQTEGLTAFKALANPYLSGTYRGHKVVINTFSKGSGRSRRYYLQFIITMSTPIEGEFTFEKKSFWNGRQGVETGDPEIDKVYRIKTENPDIVKRMLRNHRLLQGFLDLCLDFLVFLNKFDHV